MLRGGWGESIYLAGTGGEINSVHFCRVIATTHHCFLSGILSHFTAAWRSTRQAVFLFPSFYHLYLFFYSLYLFSQKPSKKNTSFSLRSNPLGYSREPILQRLISQQGNSRWPTCSRKKRSAMSTDPNTAAPMAAVLGLRVRLITAKHSFRR